MALLDQVERPAHGGFAVGGGAGEELGHGAKGPTATSIVERRAHGIRSPSLWVTTRAWGRVS